MVECFSASQILSKRLYFCPYFRDQGKQSDSSQSIYMFAWFVLNYTYYCCQMESKLPKNRNQIIFPAGVMAHPMRETSCLQKLSNFCSSHHLGSILRRTCGPAYGIRSLLSYLGEQCPDFSGSVSTLLSTSLFITFAHFSLAFSGEE